MPTSPLHHGCSALAGAAVEGVAVGTAQWAVLRGRLDGLAWRSWAGATALGAFAAWALGMLPSTLMSGAAESSGAAASAAEPSTVVQMLLAAGMGLVADAILGFPQSRALARFVRRPGVWVLANSLAWAAGLPLTFLAAGSMPEGIPVAGIVAVVATDLVVTGAVVGAVHGAFLVRLLREPSSR